MLLSLTGASGARKSTVLARLRGIDWGAPVECVEFDSIGVPSGADTAWRHAAIETWVQHAVLAQGDGRHLLLCGQVPFGELLAAPSTPLLNGVAACVLHCSPDVRVARLRLQGEPEDSFVHHVRFGEWFLRHSQDPAYAPDVIRVDDGVPMEWSRWEDWQSGDPRWDAHIVDTDGKSPDAVATDVEAWVRRKLAT